MSDDEVLPAFQRTATGQPTLVPAFVLFLDLLGVTNFARGDQAEEMLRLLDMAIEAARVHTHDPAPFIQHDFGSAWFSDNLALAMPYDTDGDGGFELGHVVDAAAHVQLTLVGHGLVCRGGIAEGQFFMDDRMAFGPALVEAVGIERSVASVPRIVLSAPTVARAASHRIDDGNAPDVSWDRELFVDDDGRTFVSYLEALGAYHDSFEDARDEVLWHRDVVRELLVRHPRSSPHHRNYAWLARYHNAWCDRRDMTDLKVEGHDRAFGRFRDVPPNRENGGRPSHRAER